MAKSFQSLSSDEDGGGWDLATAPHVNRTTLKHSTRTNLYSTLADDESSEASFQSMYDNCLIQGTFTSTERISIRWASPLKDQLFPEPLDGRRRARVGKVVGHMTCTIIDISEDGVRMRLDYQGTCSNIWFPGVATMLGLDVALNSYNCDVAWPSDLDGNLGWTVDGDSAVLSGFNVGSNHNPLSRQTSLELPTIPVQEGGHSRRSTLDDGRPGPSRATSSSSLLRIPIPSQSTTEYSFEDSPLMTPATSNMPSSIASLTPSISQSSLALAMASQEISERKPPSTPITLHINMNELLPSKNSLTFNISGTVLVTRQISSSSAILGSIDLPVFQVLSSDENEEADVVVRNQTEGAIVEVHNSFSGGSTISQDKLVGRSKDRKVTLPVGTQSKCDFQGTEILVKTLMQSVAVKSEDRTPTLQQSLHPSPVPSPPVTANASLSPRGLSRSSARHDGPLIIPWILANVTPSISRSLWEWSYAVTLSLPTPSAASSEWLEFGFATSHLPRNDSGRFSPRVGLTCASIDGVPIHMESFDQEREADDSWFGKELSISKKADSSWFQWTRVRIASQGNLEIVYVVSGEGAKTADGKRPLDVPLFLPRFSLPVARLQVDLDSPIGWFSTLYD